MNLFSTLTLGFTAGLRSMSAPAAASWATRQNGSERAGNRLPFLNQTSTSVVLTALAVGELVADKLPSIPDRRSPPSFAARIVTGAISGAACNPDDRVPGAMLGAAAATAGTLAGSALRSRLASLMGKDLPAALAEDALVMLLLTLALTNLARHNHLADTQIGPG